jgi:hypothetical protein
MAGHPRQEQHPHGSDILLRQERSRLQRGLPPPVHHQPHRGPEHASRQLHQLALALLGVRRRCQDERRRHHSGPVHPRSHDLRPLERHQRSIQGHRRLYRLPRGQHRVLPERPDQCHQPEPLHLQQPDQHQPDPSEQHSAGDPLQFRRAEQQRPHLCHQSPPPGRVAWSATLPVRLPAAALESAASLRFFSPAPTAGLFISRFPSSTPAAMVRRHP